jgi:hypothetical protein
MIGEVAICILVHIKQYIRVVCKSVCNDSRPDGAFTRQIFSMTLIGEHVVLL